MRHSSRHSSFSTIQRHSAPTPDVAGVAVPQVFTDRCFRASAMLMGFAQDEVLAAGSFRSMFAVARFHGEHIDIDSQVMHRAQQLEPGGPLVRSAVLTPDAVQGALSSQVFLSLARSLPFGPEFLIALRVFPDVWMPSAGLTPAGVAYLKSLPASEQLRVSGAFPLWTVEFLSPGPQWYVRGSHPIQHQRIQPAEMVSLPASACFAV